MKTTKFKITLAAGMALMLGLASCSNNDEPMTKGLNGETLPSLPQKKKSIEKEKLCNLFETSTPVRLEIENGSYASYFCDLGNESLKDKWSSTDELVGYNPAMLEDVFIQNGIMSVNIFQDESYPHPLYGAWKRYCTDLGHTINVYHKIPTSLNPEEMTLEVKVMSNYGYADKLTYNINGFSNDELSLYNLRRSTKYGTSGIELPATYFINFISYDTSKELKKDNGRDYYFDNDREARDFMLRTLREKYGRFVPKVIVNSIPDEKEIDLDKVEKELAEWPSVWD